MPDAHSNFAASLVALAPSPATTGTSLDVTAGEGLLLFPKTPFNATIWPSGAQPTAANAEIVTVTAVSTDSLTIVRQAELTNARAVVIGDQIAATITQKTFNDIEGELAPSTDQMVRTGYGLYKVDSYEIASGKNLEIELLAALEIG